MKSKGGKRFAWLLFIAVLLSCAALAVANLTEFLEIKEIGYEGVYFTNLRAKAEVYLISFLLVFILFFANMLFYRKNMLSRDIDISMFSTVKGCFGFAFVAAVIGAYLTGRPTYSLYLLFKNSLPFEASDPIFGHDIGYYLFQRPFLHTICESVLGILLFQIIYTALLYTFFYLKRDILSFKNIINEKAIIIHNILNIIIYLTFRSVSYKFSAESILYRSFAGFRGAGFTDIFIWMKYYKIAPFWFIAMVILILAYLIRGKIKRAVISVALSASLFIVAFIAALIVQVAFVKPYESSVEQKYVNFNIEATKTGFGLGDIVEREFPAEDDLTPADLKSHAKIIQNVTMTDPAATLAAANAVQSHKNYYAFHDSDIANYRIDGSPTSVSIAVRELDQQKLEDAGKSYVNKRLRYTHGYGLVMSPTNTVNRDGQPQFLVKDIPLESYSGAPKVSQPRIYYGELTNDYVIVGSTFKEIDYSVGGEDIEYDYKGSGGIPLNYLSRTLFALKHGDFMMLLSGYTTPESKILTNRNILERVRAVAPFLDYDDNPYIVITDDGRLKWVIDAYTTTSDYPYSQTYEGINYIRNSAKAVIDAYDGTTRLYITDRSDPIIMVYNRMYPGLFMEEGLPPEIAAHAKYPEKLFKIQAEVYKKYHVTRADSLFSSSDVWVFAKQKSTTGESMEMKPYYNLSKLYGVDAQGEELLMMMPFTPSGKENMVAVLAARPGASKIKRLICYKFPTGKTVFSPLYIENKISKDSGISKEITLLGEGGGAVFKGNMLVLPIKNSLIYVKPIYVTTKNTAAVPEVKAIIVSYNNDVVMEPTVEKALSVLLGAQKPTVVDDEKTLDDVITEAISNFKDMQNFSREGDFENFGSSLAKLEKSMEELEKMQGEASGPSESTGDGENTGEIRQENF